MLIVQLCLYCLIFTMMVKLAVRGGAVNLFARAAETDAVFVLLHLAQKSRSAFPTAQRSTASASAL